MWEPGTPANTEEDRQRRQAWRKQRALERQRKRRQGRTRIDYYPSPEALQVIRSLMQPRVGGDYSSVINRLIAEGPHERSVIDL